MHVCGDVPASKARVSSTRQAGPPCRVGRPLCALRPASGGGCCCRCSEAHCIHWTWVSASALLTGGGLDLPSAMGTARGLSLRPGSMDRL